MPQSRFHYYRAEWDDYRIEIGLGKKQFKFIVTCYGYDNDSNLVVLKQRRCSEVDTAIGVMVTWGTMIEEGRGDEIGSPRTKDKPLDNIE